MKDQELENDFTKNVYTSRDIRLADKKFLEIWPDFKAEFGIETGFGLEISCTYRSPKAQNDLYQLGRTQWGNIVTHLDGYKKLSKHNIFPSKAIDVYVHFAGKAVWDHQFYKPLDFISKKYGLEWGGNWEKFKDMPHLEIPDSV